MNATQLKRLKKQGLFKEPASITTPTKPESRGKKACVQCVDVPHAELKRLISAAEMRTMDARKALGMAVEAIFQVEHALLKLRYEAERVGHIGKVSDGR